MPKEIRAGRFGEGKVSIGKCIGLCGRGKEPAGKRKMVNDRTS